MYLCFLFCILLFIPIILCSTNETTIKKVMNSTKTKTDGAQLQEKYIDSSNLSMMNEGGSVVPNLPTLTLPKEKHINLINLDKEIEKSNKTSVKPRKGVVYTPNDDSADMNLNKERIDTTVSEKSSSLLTPEVMAKSSVLDKTVTSTDNKGNSTNSSNISEKPVVMPKKPLVLSYEALSEKAIKVESEQKLTTKLDSSPKSIVADQLPSPNVKVQPMNASRHPDLIMPIVISILVVPMFAILGYMALRRGQEAWRNRHYKRMDFLLDGMYND